MLNNDGVLTIKQVFNPIRPLQQSKKRLSLIESGRNDRKELLFKRNDL